MLRIVIPNGKNSQVKYAFSCLMTEFLGLDNFVFTEEAITNFRIDCNEKGLEILNVCSSNSPDSEMDLENIDVHKGIISIDSNSFDFVSLFGIPELISKNDNYFLNSDIIGSTFFMLTRWEEYLSNKKDAHGRFPAKESLAYKHDFLGRPIVNEYVELLWAILQKMGCKQKRKKRTYTLVPTHDVDKPYMFDGWLRNLRYVAGSVKRGRITELARYTTHLATGSDPFDTYDRMMDLSERENTKSHFFFLQKGIARADENHDLDTPKIKRLIQHIQARGHKIGFHPSYNAYNDETLFRKEKQNLERISDQQIDSGRHHFLRWDVKTTPQIWQENNMKWDSTLGYADHAGFRCGICYPFPLYDLKNNRQLDVYERPLIAMEWSLIHYQGLDIKASEKYIQKLKTEVKKYQGEFVFLYHNSAFFTDDYVHLSQRLLKSFYD